MRVDPDGGRPSRVFWDLTGLLVIIRASVITLLLLSAAACCAPTPWISLPAALVLVIALPGWAVGRTLAARGVVGVDAWQGLAAGIVMVPVWMNWVWRISNDRWFVLGAMVLLNALLVGLAAWARHRRTSEPAPPRRASRAFALLVGGVAACVFLTIWLPRAFDRVVPQAVHDYVKHHAVLLSLELAPLPLRNVFYAGEPDTPYYYYQYHHQLAAGVRKLTGDRVSIPLAFGLTSAATATALLGLLRALALRITGSPAAALTACVCASIVGGWDALPVALQVLSGKPPPIILDTWSPIPWRVHNLMTQYVWCPQHVAALAALVLAALWLDAAPRAGWWIVAAPVLAASIFGSSVYLAMTFFAAAAAYAGLRLVGGGLESVAGAHAAGPGESGQGVRSDDSRGRASSFATRYFAALLTIGLFGALLTVRQAWEYWEMSQRFPGGLTLRWDRFEWALLGRLAPPGPLANLLDAPWILLVDLGFAGPAMVLVGGAFWRRVWRDQGGRLLTIAGALGTVALFTARSDVNPLDYSFRVAIMPMQIIAAIAAGSLATDLFARRRARPAAAALASAGLLLGLPVGAYEAPLMAARSLILPNPRRDDAGALRYVRRHLPRDAVVQGDPRARLDLPQLVDRRSGVLDPDNSHVRVFFPRDEARLRSVFAAVERAFVEPDPAEAHRALRMAGVTHVLAGTLERRRFGRMLAFHADALFETLYADESASVIRLRQAVP